MDSASKGTASGSTPTAVVALPASPFKQPSLFFDYSQNLASTPAVVLAFRIALYYLIFGFIWIAASDFALDFIVNTVGNRWIFNQTFKGWFFIILTASLLFLMVRHFIVALQNAQRDMRERLEGVAEQYRTLFHRNPSAMIIFDPVTRHILAANDVSLLLYGFSRDELLKMTTLDLVVEEERPRIRASIKYEPGAVQNVGPFQVRRRDGRIIFVEAMTHEVEFNGKPSRIALISDVTDRLRSERSLALYRSQLEQRVAERTTELSRANERLRQEVLERLRIEDDLRAATAAAEAANKAKSTFLAQTSHEIRTPLTSILGYVDLLQEAAVQPQDRARYLEVVRHNARHLSALIDDLLDLSRSQMGNLRLAFDDVSPRQVAVEAVEFLQNRARERGLELRTEIDDGLPETIRTDGLRLRQILLNLMDNALKFTLEGRVVMAVRRAPDAPGIIQFEVADTGIGIDQKFLDDIFEPFFQIEQGSTRRFGGSGLGLAVSRQLAKLMGGQLAVTSTEGGGSTFTLSLSTGMVKPEPSTEVRREQDNILKGHILLAEDNDNIRLLVSEYLIRAGATVTAVVNGLEAVNHVAGTSANSQTPGGGFDLILLDLHMPALDGNSAMKQIREMGFTGPIVGLTADIEANSSSQPASEGWDAVCTKPIDRKVFLPMLAKMLPKGRLPAEQ